MAPLLERNGASEPAWTWRQAPLEVARARARQRGLDNVEYLQGDVHALPFADGSFDRVTSRLGVMFFADLAKALGELHRVLKPGGKIALLAWGAIEQPYFESTIGTVRRLGRSWRFRRGHGDV